MSSYFEYTVHPSGPVVGKIIWARTPTLSVTKHVRFRHLDDLPPRLRDAIIDDMMASGRATGSLAIPESPARNGRREEPATVFDPPSVGLSRP